MILVHLGQVSLDSYGSPSWLPSCCLVISCNFLNLITIVELSSSCVFQDVYIQKNTGNLYLFFPSFCFQTLAMQPHQLQVGLQTRYECHSDIGHTFNVVPYSWLSWCHIGRRDGHQVVPKILSWWVWNSKNSMVSMGYASWLVVWNFFVNFSIYRECHHPN